MLPVMNFANVSMLKSRSFLLAWGIVIGLLSQSLTAGYARTPQADKPYVVEYYYKVKWGMADEFIRLFKKNHLPVLKKQVETGRMLKVTAVKPRYHNTEDG